MIAHTPLTEQPIVEIEVIPDPVVWIEANFYIPETRQPIQLMDYQKAVIREALSPDPTTGLFKYSTVLYSDIKKSAKSTIAGAVALYLAWHHSYETVRIVANDLKQADSRTFRAIENAIRLHPNWDDKCKLNNYEITLLHNNTTIQAVPVDPKGEAGGGDLFTCYTELWAYKNTASQQLWVETALSPLKFGKSMRWGETYAGYIGESPVLELLYDTGVKHGTPIQLKEVPDLELWVTGRQLTMWNTRPRCYWQTPEYYADQASQYTPNEYNRIHRNEWGQSSEAFVPAAWWDACLGEYPEFGRNVPVVIGIDAAVSGDCFALVGISRLNKQAYVRFVYVWYPPKNGQISFSEPMDKLSELIKQLNVVCVCYDEYQMSMFAQQMTEKGNIFMQPFSQAGKRLEADKNLYDHIRERRITHDGNEVLREHVLNANQKADGDNKLRIIKRHETMKVDATVSCSMALHIASELGL